MHSGLIGGNKDDAGGDAAVEADQGGALGVEGVVQFHVRGVRFWSSQFPHRRCWYVRHGPGGHVLGPGGLGAAFLADGLGAQQGVNAGERGVPLIVMVCPGRVMYLLRVPRGMGPVWPSHDDKGGIAISNKPVSPYPVVNKMVERYRRLAMKLGRLGAWYSTDKLGGPQEIKHFVGTVEKLGYDTLWYPESRGYESFAVAGFMLANTSSLKIGSSIASIYARDAFTSRRGMMTLNELYGGRFILGLGVSHPPMVEGVRGHVYEKPIPAMRNYLKGIQAGEAGAADFPVCVAALGPLMLKLSGEMTQGAVPYNTNPRHTAEAAKILGPNKWCAIEQKVTLEADPVKARALGRKELARYLTLDNYRNNFLRIGFTEADFANGGSDNFIDQMVLWGGADKVKAGLRAHFDAGATHVAIQPVHDDGDIAARDHILSALADT